MKYEQKTLFTFEFTAWDGSPFKMTVEGKDIEEAKKNLGTTLETALVQLTSKPS